MVYRTRARPCFWNMNQCYKHCNCIEYVYIFIIDDPRYQIKIWGTIGLFFWICSLVSSFIFTRFEKYSQQVAASDFVSKEDSVERFSFSSIRKFDRRFWLVCCIILCLYLSKYNFLRIFSLLFKEKFEFNNDNVRVIVTSLATILPIFTWPILGILIDKLGHQITLLIISSIINTTSYIMFCYLPDGHHFYCLIPLILFGISQGAYFVFLYTLVPLLVRPNAIGTGFGIASACEFFGVSISPLLLELLVPKNHLNHNGKDILLVFIIFSIIGILLSVILLIVDFLHVKNQRPAIDVYNSYKKRLAKQNSQNSDRASNSSIQ